MPGDIETLSTAISDKFAFISLNNIELVHIFYPMTGKQEFNSLLLKEKLLELKPQIKFVLPKITAENKLTNILWDDETPLANNRWGITEPEHGTEIASEKIDMVIVPLLAFDQQGNRVGYGKGFYDRFFTTCRADVRKIGVSYFEPEETFEDLNRYDVPLDHCVTPQKIWSFR